MEIEDEVDILMSSDIVAAQMSTKNITFSRAQSGWLFKEDKSVSGTFNYFEFTWYLPAFWTNNLKVGGGVGRRVGHLYYNSLCRVDIYMVFTSLFNQQPEGGRSGVEGREVGQLYYNSLCRVDIYMQLHHHKNEHEIL